jgi:hypothetical protein
MKNLLILISILLSITSSAQTDSTVQIKRTIDSLFIEEVESKKSPAKVLHAEPLYIDLIRDLGARKGEKEWNLGLGLTDQTRHDLYTALVEYEFAPINRLGFEVELPFSFYYPVNGARHDSIPSGKLNSFKLATQYSFFVSERIYTSLAIGYIHEFELTAFKDYGKQQLFQANIFNPFFVVAKRWGTNFHSLIYTGPVIEKSLQSAHIETIWQVNTNVHYMIPGTRNFVGVEFNKELSGKGFDMVIRPQMRVGITDNLLVGIVTGIPISRTNERFSSFLRVIYEPGHRLFGKHKPV